ncbi:MAG: ComF family protein [Bacteroidales bacterium]|nr:ComF family protein [Bacteroidales bacterium]
MNWIIDFIELLFPRVCGSCGKPLENNEETLCTLCIANLPFTNFHLYNDNPVAQIFWGRVNIRMATALLYFHKKGRTQHLLHNLKYNNRPDIGLFLGRLLANQIKNHSEFSSINYIVPVPLHPKRLKERGYNQAECFANGISEILNIPVCNSLLVRAKETSTQTQKTREERWKNVSEAFSVNYNLHHENKHYLLVDDVLTTGATLEACAQAILSIPQSSISIAVIAKA